MQRLQLGRSVTDEASHPTSDRDIGPHSSTKLCEIAALPRFRGFSSCPTARLCYRSTMWKRRNFAPHPPAASLAYARVLWGWQEIAFYCRRSRRTVRQWHRVRPLPITYLGYHAVIPVSAMDLWILQGEGTREGQRRNLEE